MTNCIVGDKKIVIALLHIVNLLLLCEPMYFFGKRRRVVSFLFVFLLAISSLMLVGHWNAPAAPGGNEAAAIQLNLTDEARQALQASDPAFPSETAGFSAYYRMETDGTFSLEKGTVDDHIFGPLPGGATTVRLGPASLLEIGDNYTIASLTLENVDELPSSVNLYYDDEGWIVAYLPSGTPSSEVWQAREVDFEDPEITDISNTTLLDAINVVVVDALEGTAIQHDDEDLGYYHWQHADADNFLMMAISRGMQGEYPVQFSVPTTLTIAEVAGTLWISQGTNAQAPCATVTLDDSDLISEECEKGIFSATANLSDFNSTTGHSWKLVQSNRDEGGSGALLMILYSVSS